VQNETVITATGSIGEFMDVKVVLIWRILGTMI